MRINEAPCASSFERALAGLVFRERRTHAVEQEAMRAGRQSGLFFRTRRPTRTDATRALDQAEQRFACFAIFQKKRHLFLVGAAGADPVVGVFASEPWPIEGSIGAL